MTPTACPACGSTETEHEVNGRTGERSLWCADCQTTTPDHELPGFDDGAVYYDAAGQRTETR